MKNTRRFRTFLIVLALMILGLMALGAGVRTMNAGLSCPDWPLCFGKVIPDFHVGVWFEFVHRAYAGLVGLVFAAALVMALRWKGGPLQMKVAAATGFFVLIAQIFMGRLTVLMLVKAVIVSLHLLLATIFLGCVLWMLFAVDREMKKLEAAREPLPQRSAGQSVFAVLLPVVVFIQIAIGGFVASTYAGMVCVDWPYCNGQWVPTLKGPMGLQIIHRFYAYALVLLFVGLSIYAYTKRAVMEKSLQKLFYAGGVLVVLQTIVGILNLLYFIPPHITVLHQSLALLLLAVSLKISFDVRESAKFARTFARPTPSENLAVGTATLS